MKSALLGGLAGTAVLLGAAAGTGAERSRLVKARVFITGGVGCYRHQISVSSEDPTWRRSAHELERVLNPLVPPEATLVDLCLPLEE